MATKSLQEPIQTARANYKSSNLSEALPLKRTLSLNQWCLKAANAAIKDFELSLDSAVSLLRIEGLKESFLNNIKRLLINRGLYDLASQQNFFIPRYETIRNQEKKNKLKDLSKAVNILLPLLKRRQNIVLYGDYDVDGICATALLKDACEKIGGRVFMALPDREKDGYGLQAKAISQLMRYQPAAIITVDNGMTSHQAIKKIQQLKIPVIVCDHHQPDKELPPAAAILNPKQPGERVQYKELCATGVAFYLASELYKQAGVSAGQEKWLLDLVALATICDMVPLTQDNRTLVHFGFKTLARTKRCGLAQLLSQVGGFEDLTADTVGYRIGPRLNAAGRLEHARQALDLICTDRAEMAQTICKSLEKLNAERQRLTNQVLLAARAQAQLSLEAAAWVLAHPTWPRGICGLVASRLVEEYNRPVFVLEEGDICVGSGRSVPGFDLAGALQSMPEIFIRAGGHPAAAGCTIRKNNLAEFKKRFAQIVKKNIGTKTPKIIFYELELTLSDISLTLAECLQKFEPFGIGNARPLLKISNCKITRLKPVGREKKHLSLLLEDHGITRRAIAFNWGSRMETIPQNVELLAYLKINQWRGWRSPELEIVDFKEAS